MQKQMALAGLSIYRHYSIAQNRSDRKLTAPFWIADAQAEYTVLKKIAEYNVLLL